MKQAVKLVVLLLASTTMGILSSQTAAAQCGGLAHKTSLPAAPGRSLFHTAALTDEPDNRWSEHLEPIVGLWKITFTDKGKDYTDTGYAAWHSDFTEFQNSQRAPSTGAVCQGVWVKVGYATYRLNHFALAYNDSTTLTNIIRIREEVTVSRSRKTFSGVFITDVYDTSHNLQVEFKGPITGRRVTIDSDINSQ